MKKLLSILLVCLVLFGCTKKQEKPDLSKEFVIETYKADMSGYENLKSSGHMFVGTTVSELKRTVDEVLYETIPENENGERDLQTPEVVTIVDGKITGSQIGTTWGGSNYTDKDVTKLEDIYRKLLTPFVQESQD